MIHFSHYHVGRGRLTVAYSTSHDRVTFGFAFCSPHDQFNRARGREIAEGRLRKRPGTLMLIVKDGNPHMMFRANLNKLFRYDPACPSWAYTAMRLYR